MATPIDQGFQEDFRSRKIIAVLGSLLIGAVVAIGLSAIYKGFGFVSTGTSDLTVGEKTIVAVSDFISVFMFAAYLIILGSFHPRFDCPQCGKSLNSGEQWWCGRCGHENEPTTFWFGTVITRCCKCWQKPHTLRCPHCDREIDLVVEPDRRHAAVFPQVQAIGQPPKYKESTDEIAGRKYLEQQLHAEALAKIEHQTETIEAETRKATAEAKLSRQQMSGGGAAIAEIMKEIQGAFARTEALGKFFEIKKSEINTNSSLEKGEKARQIMDLEDLINEAKARYL